tara:strand:+ start:89 stop:268 length:180 start_codon:yes stop_codon:yes gene_type:complete
MIYYAAQWRTNIIVFKDNGKAILRLSSYTGLWEKTNPDNHSYIRKLPTISEVELMLELL